MNSKRLAFQVALRKDVPNVVNISGTKNLKELFLIKKLGLDKLPENIECSLSTDGTYINIKFKDDNNDPAYKHLNFQIPLEEISLDFLDGHPKKDALYSRYRTYDEIYRIKFIEYVIAERTFLKKQFPNLISNQKIRLKSEPSYANKVNKNIKYKKSPIIDDILAERIIITAFNNSTKPEDLEKACYIVAEALEDFRKKTNFQVKQPSFNNSTYKSDLPYISKDYIKKPKLGSGYRSLHTTFQDVDNPDFTFERQIRTLDMEIDAKESENQAHYLSYKPRFLNDLSLSILPKYTEVTNFIDSKTGLCIAFNLDECDSFYNYYSILSHSQGVYITYEKYIEELAEMKKYINFEDIRQKLKELHKNKQKSREDD